MQSTNLISKNQTSVSDPETDPKDTVAIRPFSYDYELKEARSHNGAIVPLYWATLKIKGQAILFRDGSCNVMAIEVWHNGQEVGDLVRGMFRWDWIEKSVTAWVRDEVFAEYRINHHLKIA